MIVKLIEQTILSMEEEKDEWVFSCLRTRLFHLKELQKMEKSNVNTTNISRVDSSNTFNGKPLC